MSPSPRRGRVDESLADRLIDTAEVLYGEHGIGGVSLRQISAAAGTANNYAVQYHFGDAATLIQAVLEKRMPEIERRRAALLARAKAAGQLGDLRVLNEVLYGPLIEHRDARGERSFARFVLALFSAANGLSQAPGSEQLAPVSEHVLDLQSAVLPEIPPELLRERHRLVVFMILNSIFNRRDPLDERFDAAHIENVLDMATAALTAPVSKNVRTMLKQPSRTVRRRT